MKDAMQAKNDTASPRPASDIDLARAVAAGDEAALKTLMRRHNQTLYRTARSILRDEADAEDVVQDAYLLAYRAMPGFRGDARLSTWLIRIVVNLALRRRQRQARERARRVEAANPEALSEASGTFDEEYGEMRETTPGHLPTPENAASTAELRRLLEAHIDRLPALYREVFVLRGIEELDVEETAAVLGLPEATVRTRFFRARHVLREGLAKDIDFALNDAFSFAGDRCDRIVAGVLGRLRRRSRRAAPDFRDLPGTRSTGEKP